MRGQRNGAVARDEALILPRLGNGNHRRLPPLLWDLSCTPGAVDDGQQGATGDRAEMTEHLVGQPVGHGRLLQLESAELTHQSRDAERGACRRTPSAPAFRSSMESA